MADQIPPLSGVSRKQRSDKGVPRKSSVTALADLFMERPAEEQEQVLALLVELHRQVKRGRIPAAKPEAEETACAGPVI